MRNTLIAYLLFQNVRYSITNLGHYVRATRPRLRILLFWNFNESTFKSLTVTVFLRRGVEMGANKIGFFVQTNFTRS